MTPAPKLFDEKTAIKPLIYPDAPGYMQAIQHSYWLHTEFNLTEDVQDYHRLPAGQRSVARKTLLGISNVEVAVKRFWGSLADWITHPELTDVFFTLSENEVRHKNTYASFLERMGFEAEFARVGEIPAIRDRMAFYKRKTSIANVDTHQDLARSIILFSLFTEHVSLLSQFLILKSFQKHLNVFKGSSNFLDATALEEIIHGKFGFYLVNIMREEYPEWFDEDFITSIVNSTLKAYAAEEKMLDWILSEGDVPNLSREAILNFIRSRFNDGLTEIGMPAPFSVDTELLQVTDWFEEELLAGKHVDFFHKRPVNYHKKAKSITADDLF